jgi:formyl-CoA transferase
LIGRPDLAEDPSFKTREARREHQQALLAILSAWAATHAKEEIYHTLQELRSVAGYVATVEDLLASGQLSARAFFQPLDHPDTGRAMYPGAPFRLGGEAWQQTRAPRLGEHNGEVYGGQLGLSQEELGRLRGLGVI